MRRNRIKNGIIFLTFVAAIGTVCSLVLWAFLFLVNMGTELLWEFLPEKTGGFAAYPVIVCAVGGLMIGLFRKRYGDYPQGMMEVFGTLKKNGTYPYRKIRVLFVAALLPLILGSSVGPEAGMVGIITALCCWAGENLRFAGTQSAKYSEIGASVSLSLIFHSPLFGLLHMEEGKTGEAEGDSISRGERVVIYVAATAAALGVFRLLNTYLYDVSMGFPSFETALPEGLDYAVMFLYIAAGILLALFFEVTEKGFAVLSGKLPPVAGEVLAGTVLGIIVMVLPVVQFSGEHQMGVLIADYMLYPAAGMMGIAFLKILMTNMCIQLGLKGGHFFPLIFAAVCMGYGMALTIWPGAESHAAFAAAVTTASTLGFTMRKPIAVTMLLFLCFPVRMVFWIVFAAAIASWLAGMILNESPSAAQALPADGSPEATSPEER
ncbi:MAG: chloride channel protein [Anaerovoracaceae bacterium]